VPGTWPGGGDDAPDDPDGEADAPAAGGPVHPDDRLWRHPSELAWLAPASAPAAGADADAAARPGGRVWTLAVTSGLTGFALALGVVALVGTLTAPSEGEPAGPLAFAGTAATTPTGLAAVAESVMPSVVRVEVDGRAGGTGVVVLDDGHVLTSATVVEGAEQVVLLVAGGERIPGRVVGVDRLTDLAVLAPTAGHDDDVVWTAAPLAADDGDLARGDAVVAVGAADGGRPPSLSVGVVAALGRRLATAGGWLHGMIETDAPVADGATGGPLCDRTGTVVGLSTAGDGGAGYATPIGMARSVAEALVADGVVHHVWLGIEGTDLAAAAVLPVEGIAGSRGVAVERVLPGSPAETAGLEAGDALVGLDGSPVGSMDDLVGLLRRYSPGDEVDVTVRRGNGTAELTVALAERPD
jgi:putative serine protease PepD